MTLCLPPEVPLFDADGALSREYLLHRGYCCGNGCRNCPYDGCGPAPAPAVIPARVPRRIVSLCPSNTEILHALGLLDRVVGVDDWSDWPPQVAEKPCVGPDLGVDLDRVEALRPDLVIASLSVPGMERNVEGLRRRGLPHLVLDGHSLGEIWESIRTVGRATGTAERAEAVIAGLQERIQRVRAAVARARRRPRVYWEWWPKPLFSPGGRNWLTPLSELAGCASVTRHVDAAAARPEPEEIVRTNPELILLAWTGVATEKVRPEVVRRRPGWQEITAVRTGRIHVMEEGLFCRPSPRLIDGLEQLAALAHPEALPHA
ncbi:MAG: helical backbone metal receptor [Armatimonadota bacterium]